MKLNIFDYSPASPYILWLCLRQSLLSFQIIYTLVVAFIFDMSRFIAAPESIFLFKRSRRRLIPVKYGSVSENGAVSRLD